MKYLVLMALLLSCGKEDDSESSQTDQYTGKYELIYVLAYDFDNIGYYEYSVTEGKCFIDITKSNDKYTVAHDNDCSLKSGEDEQKLDENPVFKDLDLIDVKPNTAIPLPGNSNITPVDNSTRPALKLDDNLKIEFNGDGFQKVKAIDTMILQYFYKAS